MDPFEPEYEMCLDCQACKEVGRPCPGWPGEPCNQIYGREFELLEIIRGLMGDHDGQEYAEASAQAAQLL